jgi:putative transposase
MARLPAYAPELNPVEGDLVVLKRGVLANLAVASFGHLTQVIQARPEADPVPAPLIEGCLVGTGLALELAETPTDITN